MRWTGLTFNRNREFPADTSDTWRVISLMLTSLQILSMLDVLWNIDALNNAAFFSIATFRDPRRSNTLRSVHIAYNEYVAMYTRGIKRLCCDVYTWHTTNTMLCYPSTTTCNNTIRLHLRILSLRHDFQHIMLMNTRTIQWCYHLSYF